MSMRPTDRKRLVLMAVLAIAGVVAFFLARSRPVEPAFPELIPASPPRAEEPRAKDLAPDQVFVATTPRHPVVSPPSGDSAPPPTKPRPASEPFAKAFRECFADVAVPASPREYLRELAARGEVEAREVQLENLHVQIDGAEKRMQSRWRPHGQEIQYYEVDPEGLPLPKGSFVLMTHEQAAEQKQRFWSRGERLFEQKTESWRLKNGERVVIDWRGGEPFEFSARAKDRALSCRESGCLCRWARR